MSDSQLSDDRLRKYHEGWTKHQAEGKKEWKKYWMVLRGNMIFIFTSEDTSRGSMVGSLTLTPDTELETLPPESRKKGFKYRLTTVSATSLERKVNTFKFDKENDRDFWKAYIVGITVGIVPSDVHLLPGQLRDVHSVIDEVRNTPPPVPTLNRPTIPRPTVTRRSSNGSDDSGSLRDIVPSRGSDVDLDNANNLRDLWRRQNDLVDKSLQSPSSRLQTQKSKGGYARDFDIDCSNRNRPQSDGNALDLLSLSDACPNHGFDAIYKTKGHTFYLNEPNNATPPSWFFDNLTRAESENILTVGRTFGNVLLRPSSNFPESGKYVISTRRDVSGGTYLNHYEVVQTPEGFKLNVENKHSPMRCLSEVMNFFISVSGTKPMRTNDLQMIYQSTLPQGGRSVSYDVNSNGQTTMYPTKPPSNRPLQVFGQVAPDVQKVVRQMNYDLQDPESSDLPSPGLGRTVPARTAPSGTLQRQYGNIGAFNFPGAADFSAPSSSAVPPPPPPPPPTVDGSTGVPYNSTGGGVPPPPPVNSLQAAVLARRASIDVPGSGPLLRPVPPARPPVKTFESELQGRLQKQKEVVYASGAQILKNF